MSLAGAVPGPGSRVTLQLQRGFYRFHLHGLEIWRGMSVHVGWLGAEYGYMAWRLISCETIMLQAKDVLLTTFREPDDKQFFNLGWMADRSASTTCVGPNESTGNIYLYIYR